MSNPVRWLTARVGLFLAAAVASLTVVVLPLAPAPAFAADCTTGVHLAVSKSVLEGGPTGAVAPQEVARVGDAIDFTVAVSLLSTDCPLSQGTVTLTTPAGTTQTLADGTLTLAPGQTQSFTQSDLALPLYVVSASDISTTAFAGSVLASASVTGTATQTSGLQVNPSASTQTGVPVIRPETTLTTTASPTSGAAPLSVTYTFVEKNVSPDTVAAALALDGITGTTVTDSNSACTPAPKLSGGVNVGDTNKDKVLNAGESWTYTCTVKYAAAGSFIDTASATGVAGDGRPAGTVDSEGASADEAAGPASVSVGSPAPTSDSPAPDSTDSTDSPSAAAGPTDSEPPLALTGVEVGGITVAALIALVGGGLALVAGRRRRGENRAH